jgi:hypothetical protein
MNRSRKALYNRAIVEAQIAAGDVRGAFTGLDAGRNWPNGQVAD